MGALGLFNIDGVTAGSPAAAPIGAYARLQSRAWARTPPSATGRSPAWSAPSPCPPSPEGFPPELIAAFEAKTGYKVLCNKPYSGTEVLKDYGEQAMAGKRPHRLHQRRQRFSGGSQRGPGAGARAVPHLRDRPGDADRPLRGAGSSRGPSWGDCAANFKRTTNRHDLSLKPPRAHHAGTCSKPPARDVIAVGKIYDIFDGQGRHRKDQDHRQHQRHCLHPGFADPRF